MGKVCASRLKVANFTSRSRVRPRQIHGKGCASAEKLQLYLALRRSTTPIPGKGCTSCRKVCDFTSRSVARPRQSLVRVCASRRKSLEKSLQFLPRVSRDRPTPIHGKGLHFPIDGVGAGSGFRKNALKYRDVDKSDADNSMYFTLIYFTLCTMHLTRCTSLDVLHSDVLHSVYLL